MNKKQNRDNLVIYENIPVFEMNYHMAASMNDGMLTEKMDSKIAGPKISFERTELLSVSAGSKNVTFKVNEHSEWK